MVLYILFHWSGTLVHSQLVFCVHFSVWRYIPVVSMERDVLHVHLLLCHLVLSPHLITVPCLDNHISALVLTDKGPVTLCSKTYGLMKTFFYFIFISWRLITLQYCSGFCHTLT